MNGLDKDTTLEKDFEYSNLNIVELNDFLKKDTNNYKDLANSLCGKIYLLETKILPEDKATLTIIENQISYEESSFEKRITDLKEQQPPEGAGFFAKMSFKKQVSKDIKSLEKDHEKTIKLLEERLKKHKKQFDENNVLFLKLLDKLKDKGYFWQEIRKLLEEKMKLGILSFDKSNSEKNKPKVKKIDPREFEELYPPKQKNKPVSSGSSFGGSGKDIDFYGDPNYFDFSKLSPMEQAEFKKLLGRYNYNRNLFTEYEEAKRLRMSMFAMDRQREFDFLRMQTSDFALHNFFNNLFGPKRDDCFWCGLCDMWGIPRDTFGYHSHGSPHEHDAFDFHDMCSRLTGKMMRDSGHGLSFIEKNRSCACRELEKFLKSPMGANIFERVYFDEFYKDSHYSHHGHGHNQGQMYHVGHSHSNFGGSDNFERGDYSFDLDATKLEIGTSAPLASSLSQNLSFGENNDMTSGGQTFDNEQSTTVQDNSDLSSQQNDDVMSEGYRNMLECVSENAREQELEMEQSLDMVFQKNGPEDSDNPDDKK